MNKTTKKLVVALIVLTFLLLPVFPVLADNIVEDDEPNDIYRKWSWGENIGWMNWKPKIGEDEYGVTVKDTHLTGFIWTENKGWIKLGASSDPDGGDWYGDLHGSYENTAADNWGVNNDGNGELSGYAYGENLGWINFSYDAVDGYTGVKIDPTNGKFSGYAWAENAGWVNMSCENEGHCYNGTLDYMVQTGWTAAGEGEAVPEFTVVTFTIAAVCGIGIYFLIRRRNTKREEKK